MRAKALAALCLALSCAAALGASAAGAADECKGLRVCLPIAGPWVAVSSAGADWELRCPARRYIVGGTDARVAAPDVDVSFRGETGSPVGPGVTTRAAVVFHGLRTRPGSEPTSFQPFLGCVPRRGGGGRGLTGAAATAPGLKPTQVLFSVAVTSSLVRSRQTVRAACPASARLVGHTHAVGFDQVPPPAASRLAAVEVRTSVVKGAVVARVVATDAAGPSASVQVRALCSRAR